MSDLVLDFVELNEQIDYTHILMVLAIYFAVLWVVVSIWVLSDSRNRYKSLILSIPWFIMVLVMNFPALLVYLMIRPDDVDWKTIIDSEDEYILPIDRIPEGGKIVISLESPVSTIERVNSFLHSIIFKRDQKRKVLTSF